MNNPDTNLEVPNGFLLFVSDQRFGELNRFKIKQQHPWARWSAGSWTSGLYNICKV